MKNDSRVVKESNGVRLVEITNSFGNVSYQVNELETADSAASVYYSGSDLSLAEKVYKHESRTKYLNP